MGINRILHKVISGSDSEDPNTTMLCQGGPVSACLFPPKTAPWYSTAIQQNTCPRKENLWIAFVMLGSSSGQPGFLILLHSNTCGFNSDINTNTNLQQVMIQLYELVPYQITACILAWGGATSYWQSNMSVPTFYLLVHSLQSSWTHVVSFYSNSPSEYRYLTFYFVSV